MLGFHIQTGADLVVVVQAVTLLLVAWLNRRKIIEVHGIVNGTRAAQEEKIRQQAVAVAELQDELAMLRRAIQRGTIQGGSA